MTTERPATRFWVGRASMPTEPGHEAEPPFRHNDGSIILMVQGAPFTEPEDGHEDPRPLVTIPRFTPAPRGKAWNTPDPAQEAFGAKLAAILTAAAERGEFSE